VGWEPCCAGLKHILHPFQKAIRQVRPLPHNLWPATNYRKPQNFPGNQRERSPW